MKLLNGKPELFSFLSHFVGGYHFFSLSQHFAQPHSDSNQLFLEVSSQNSYITLFFYPIRLIVFRFRPCSLKLFVPIILYWTISIEECHMCFHSLTYIYFDQLSFWTRRFYNEQLIFCINALVY